KRYFFDNKQQFDAEVAKLEGMRRAVYGGGPVGPGPVSSVLLDRQGQLAQGALAQYEITAQADGPIKIDLDTTAGDADLYVKNGAQPTVDAWDFRPYTDTTNEGGKIKVKKGDVLYGMVRGYAPDSDYDVNITSP